LVIIEGADGTGKTTLSHAIADYIGGQYFHCGYHKDWNIEIYHRHIIHTAARLEQQANIPCIIDRLALSEEVYGHAYRSYPSYNTSNFMNEIIRDYKPMLILCSNENAEKNHELNKEKRTEMFDTIKGISEAYQRLVSMGRYGQWFKYDFDKNDMNNFISSYFKEN
tara:strand:+ start:8201 stop:8698 length:498 start_codon:yes stop_codon:yes gene_type:complete